MVLMNYHELTMTEARDSPARRKQFLVICTVMAGVFLYSSFTSGVFNRVQIVEGTFTGGDFVYKTAKRDYAAAGSLEGQIASDLGLERRNSKEDEAADLLYTIFLDHPGQVGGGRNQRFASGLVARNSAQKAMKQQLIQRNDATEPPTRAQVLDLPATDLWPRLRYKKHSLPTAKAAVVYFPFTNGFVSSLVQSYKIIPALRRYAKEYHSGKKSSSSSAQAVVVLTTCSVHDQMCTHYAPLEQGEKFLLGQPAMEKYLESLPKKGLIDTELLKRKAKTGWKKLGLGGKKKEATSDEL